MNRKIFFAWLWVVLYAAVIFWLSSLPHPLPPSVSFVERKFLHGVEYAVFGILLVNALLKSFRYQALFLPAFFSLILGTLYAFSDEWHQSFVPGRTASVYDVAIDFVGLVIGTGLMAYWVTFLQQRVRAKGVQRG